jgi:5'-nucleotidase
LYPEDFREDVQLQPLLETAEQLTRRLRPQVDMVILLSHLGHLGDVAVAEHVTGIDLIIGGHSHTALETIHWVGQTPITRSIVGTQYMGRIVVDLETGQKPAIRDYQLVPLDASFPDDPFVTAELAKWNAKLPPVQVLGHILTPLDTRTEVKNLGESTAGNFYADAALTFFADEAELSFVHMGTLRGDRIYGPGDFTNHDLSEYHPFDNAPTLMELTAPQLKLMLENGVSHLPFASGIFLSQAGLKVTVDPSQPAQVIDPDHPRVVSPGQRIVRAEYQGQPIDFTDEARRFRVVMDGYIGRGGAGYFFTQAGRNIRQADMVGSEVVTWYLRHYSPITPKIEGRITII